MADTSRILIGSFKSAVEPPYKYPWALLVVVNDLRARIPGCAKYRISVYTVSFSFLEKKGHILNVWSLREHQTSAMMHLPRHRSDNTTRTQFQLIFPAQTSLSINK